jgi:crossover junction endodeoxyribonuclease RuvC
MTLLRGIDIGVQGAVAIIDQSGALVEIHDMPVLKDGPAGRRAINAHYSDHLQEPRGACLR